MADVLRRDLAIADVGDVQDGELEEMREGSAVGRVA